MRLATFKEGVMNALSDRQSKISRLHVGNLKKKKVKKERERGKTAAQDNKTKQVHT